MLVGAYYVKKKKEKYSPVIQIAQKCEGTFTLCFEN